MNCEIIAVGDEVLTGDIVNTNAREIAAGLEDAGVRVRRQTVTSDNPAEMIRFIIDIVSLRFC